MEKDPFRTVVIVFVLLVALADWCHAMETRQNAVEVSATVFENPARIDFSWVADPTAPEYRVFKKLEWETSWSGPIAVLDSSAVSFSDSDVQPGVVYEYSFRKVPATVTEAVTVNPGDTELTFTIHDGWGDGMCCDHGFGQYEVSGCGVTFAAGGVFGARESTTFSVGAAGGTCAEVIVDLVFDYYGNETSWELVDPPAVDPIAAGGPYSVPRFGHITTGIAIPAVEDRGVVLLIVEESLAQPLDDELKRLHLDLIGDGYRVCRRDVSADDPVTDVKELILSEHNRDPDIETLFLLGHVPVPYSGRLFSGHPDHIGAWPADVYYGELHGRWTDTTVNTTSAYRSENRNVPGDGKFDQTFLPSDVDLQIGRVDLSRLTSFAETEIELLRRYLDKDHDFRTGQTETVRRALIEDRVGSLEGFAPAATGWRNFTAMFGADHVFAGTLFPELETENYLWCYGCAGSSYTRCGSITSTAQLATTPINAVFSILYGSYFGDWDNENNMLRAPLAARGDALSCFWAGHPTWHFQHMALGHTIGYCARLTQNNVNQYMAGDGSRQIHIALMGDPTLKMHVVKPITNLKVERLGAGENGLSWLPAADSSVAYYVYRSSGLDEPFLRIGETGAEVTFIDPSPQNGTNLYMVRAMRLETSASGSYYNLSCGVLAAGPEGSPEPRLPEGRHRPTRP